MTPSKTNKTPACLSEIGLCFLYQTRNLPQVEWMRVVVNPGPPVSSTTAVEGSFLGFLDDVESLAAAFSQACNSSSNVFSNLSSSQLSSPTTLLTISQIYVGSLFIRMEDKRLPYNLGAAHKDLNSHTCDSKVCKCSCRKALKLDSDDTVFMLRSALIC